MRSGPNALHESIRRQPPLIDAAPERIMSLPVFDSTTPKVSIIEIGMETLASANELVSEARCQTAKFQKQASDKAGFMLKACDQVPGGSWMDTSKNANVDGGTLTAELQKITATPGAPLRRASLSRSKMATPSRTRT